MELSNPSTDSSRSAIESTDIDSVVPNQETECQINEKDDQIFLYNKVFQNDLLMDAILSYLVFEDLKQCRLVSWRWKNRCDNIFGKCAQLSVTLGELESLPSRDVISPCITAAKILGIRKMRDPNVNLMSFMPPHITDVCIDTKFITALCMDGLLPFKSLTITHPITLIFKGNKISPEKLILRGETSFVVNGKKDTEGLVNNYVDFEKMRVLELGSSVSLEMKGNYRVDKVVLRSTKIVNWQNSNWNIEISKFELPKTRSQISIKTIYLLLSEVDLSCLPQSVERLILETCFLVECTGLLNLPNLKYLEVISIRDSFDIGLIPPSVTKIHVSQNCFSGVGEVRIDSLIVQHRAVQELEQILQSIKPKELTIVFAIDTDSRDFEQNQGFADFLKNSQTPSITILGLMWLDGNFHISPLSTIVDQQAWSYVFKNGTGFAKHINPYERVKRRFRPSYYCDADNDGAYTPSPTYFV